MAILSLPLIWTAMSLTISPLTDTFDMSRTLCRDLYLTVSWASKFLMVSPSYWRFTVSFWVPPAASRAEAKYSTLLLKRPKFQIATKGV